MTAGKHNPCQLALTGKILPVGGNVLPPTGWSPRQKRLKYAIVETGTAIAEPIPGPCRQ
jgi:hypothetical protein